MKKILSVILIALFSMSMLVSCGTDVPEQNDDNKLSIVTTIFPEYDWVMNILGDKADEADVTMLLDNGVDLHSYQPTAEDIVRISDCDVFIYVGGESDEWVEDALKEATNENMIVINLMDVLGKNAKEEEVKEGMQSEDEDEDEPEYDEHVWLSLPNTQLFCTEITAALAESDPANSKIYEDNLESYISVLSDLDDKFRETVDKVANKTLLFGDRFPFRYMVDDYGLDYYAAFVGCSAESEASFETITFLADKMDELGLNYVLTLEGSDHKIAETIISVSKNKDAKIRIMDSMQSITSEDISAGTSYMSIMEKNLEVLGEVLQ